MLYYSEMMSQVIQGRRVETYLVLIDDQSLFIAYDQFWKLQPSGHILQHFVQYFARITSDSKFVQPKSFRLIILNCTLPNLN